MRHKVKGRVLGRTPPHRKAMFRNMAVSLIRTLREETDAKREGAAQVKGRIVTTIAKAKEIRPFVEKLVTIAKKAQPHLEAAKPFATDAARNTDAWKAWRKSEQWQKWSQAMAPALTLRRRAYDQLRDKEAVTLLFSVLAPRFQNRTGGYTRIVEVAQRRLGDAGKQALIEFVGERDRVKARRAPTVVAAAQPAAN
jgi:large subunit ribosomal protein L17